jgi:hypothetical protein
VTTNDYELYACSGLQFEKIAERQTSIIVWAAFPTDSEKYDFQEWLNTQNITFHNGRLYAIDRQWKYIIYGTQQRSLPKALCYWSPHFSTDTDDTFNEITAISAESGGTLRLAWNTWSVYQVGYVQTNDTSSVRCPEWILITSPTDLWDYSLMKTINEIRVWMEWQGELWASLDWGDFELAWTLDQTELYQKIMDYKKNFREISLMVKLNDTDQDAVLQNIDLRFTSFPV